MKKYLYVLFVIFAQTIFATPTQHLIIAIKDNDYEQTRYWLDNGADINATALPPKGIGVISLLELACRYQAQTKIIELLINKGANPNPGLFWIAHGNNTERADFFLNKGADVNYKQMIFMAVSRKRVKMTQWLLEHNASVNEMSTQSNSRVLIYAIFSICRGLAGETISYEPSFEILKLLIQHGADSSLPVYKDRDIYYYINTIDGIPTQDKEEIFNILSHTGSALL